jgi:hypothetical protein
MQGVDWYDGLVVSIYSIGLKSCSFNCGRYSITISLIMRTTLIEGLENTATSAYIHVL